MNSGAPRVRLEPRATDPADSNEAATARLKILILKPSSLGDVVHALPVLRFLKQRHPHSAIYWWADLDRLPLLEGDPDLAGVIPFDRRRWAKPQHWGELFQSVRRLRAHHFDWVIDLQALARSSLFAWAANGGFTVGLADLREGAPALYDVAIPRPSPATHAVDWYLAVLPALGVPVQGDFDWLPPRPGIQQELCRKWPALAGAGDWILLQPTARWATKQWPVERFAEVARQLARRDPRWRLAVLGGPADRAVGERIVQAAPEACLNLAGQTSLWEMVEWVRRSRLLITNDTGPMHIAAAVGTPVVALFGPTDPRRTGPYQQGDHVLQQRDLPCVPCLKSCCSYRQPFECLRSLTVDPVVQMACRLLHHP